MKTTFIVEWDRDNLPSLIVALDAITVKSYKLKEMIYAEAYKLFNAAEGRKGYQ